MKLSLNSKLLMASMMALGLAGVGCNSSGGGGGGGVIIDPIVYVWYDMYGNGCSTSSPRPGCNFYWYDSATLVKIMDFEDPYFTQTYYNLTYFDYKEFYLNGVLYYTSGWLWESPTGIIYDEYGNALNKKKGRSRDIVGDVAKQETAIVEKAGREFAAKNSISAEKGIQVAKALNEWAKMGKDRQRTDADIAAFTERLYGVDYSKVKSALENAEKGDKALLNETISDAAKNWGISSENMKGMLKRWYKNVPGLE